ncbi:MAG: toxin-antitoxin system YwqK family antitoxin [Bacteroidales bacterium]|nr:toxin-antitoxin system YwqK family antitoxin [Bacteroidales bacterium]
MRSLFLISVLVGSMSGLFSQDTINQTDKIGHKQGFWKRYSGDSILLYEGRFRDNIPVGKFIYYYPDGKIKTISVISDSGKIARTLSFFPNGKKMASGKYVEQKRDSIWLFFSDTDEQLVSEEIYATGKKVGLEKIFYPGGGVSEIYTWKDGIRDGAWIQYYDDSTCKLQASYSNGEREGKVTVYFTSGKRMIEGQYTKGHREGIWIYYHENGDIRREERYENGILLTEPELE